VARYARRRINFSLFRRYTAAWLPNLSVRSTHDLAQLRLRHLAVTHRLLRGLGLVWLLFFGHDFRLGRTAALGQNYFVKMLSCAAASRDLFQLACGQLCGLFLCLCVTIMVAPQRRARSRTMSEETSEETKVQPEDENR
jgi:hypothetical protein